jgi:hypothetical protein
MTQLSRHTGSGKVQAWVAVLSVILCMGVASTSVSAASSCLTSGRRVVAAEMERFASNPAGTVGDSLDNPAELRGRLANYISTDPSMVTKLGPLLRQATSRSRKVIGTALLWAFDACSSSQPASAQQIERFVRDLGDSSVSAGFARDLAGLRPAPPLRKPAPPKPFVGESVWDNRSSTDLDDPFAPILTPQAIR